MINPTVHELYDIIYNERDKYVTYWKHHFKHKTIPILDQVFLQDQPFTKKLIFNRDFTEHSINTIFPTLKPDRDVDFWFDWRVNESIRDFIEHFENIQISKQTPYDTWKQEFKIFHPQLSSVSYYKIIYSHEFDLYFKQLNI